MKTLLVTGKLAEPMVKKVAEKFDANVAVLPVSVALFMTPQTIFEHLKAKDLKKYDRIIFPGLIRIDLARLEHILDVQCFKGPRSASDLWEVFEKDLKLSKTEPTDSLFKVEGQKELKKALEEAEKRKEKFRVGNLKIGHGLPPRLLAEVTDSPKLSVEDNLARAQYYLDSGADIIDIGAVAGETNPKKLSEIVKKLKKKLKVPLSIDSLNPDEIDASVKAGADLVLSLDADNMKKVGPNNNVAYVVLPGAPSIGEVSKNKAESVIRNLEEARKLGFENLIADPLLDPPFGISSSLRAYSEFREKYSQTPLLVGVGNVTELMDADSPGINALLASAAIELDVSLLLTTENSIKTRNAVRELKSGIDLNFLAHHKKVLPKDLGMDVLLAKSKRDVYAPEISSKAQVIKAQKSGGFEKDIKGCFHILVDHKNKKIIAAHFKDDYDVVFEGGSAEDISKAILEQNLVSDLKHANYLGRELAKAEISLRLGRSYQQDEG